MLASNKKYKGIIFSFQVDIFYSPDQAINLNIGYRDMLNIFSNEAENFNIPIILIHGDSHRIILDQPLKVSDHKHIVENILRLEVMWAEQVQAVEITVNPTSEHPFSFNPILLKQNMKKDSSKAN